MPREETTSRRELPETVPGTPEQLIDIAREIAGSRASGRGSGGKARLQRIAAQLDHLGKVLLEGLQHQVTAPSAKTYEAQLKQVQRHASALGQALSKLPPFSLELLDAGYHVQLDWNPKTRVLSPAGLGTAWPGQAVAAILATVQLQLASWREGTVLARVPPTQQGPMRSYQRIVGDPRTFVANQVTHLVIAEMGAAAASAEEHRPVYAVVALLWEWATGLPDEGAHLRKHIRQGVRFALLHTEQAAIRKAIEEELGRYQASLTAILDLPARREHQDRVERFRAEAERLWAEEVRLHKSIVKR